MSTTDDINVSPEEMAALMDTIQDTASTRSREHQDGQPMDVVGYDLVASRAASADGFPTLNLLNARFAEQLGTELEKLSSQTVVVKTRGTETQKFVECSSHLPNPMCAQVCELIGLDGPMIVTISPDLLLMLFDYLLGGAPTEAPDADALLKARGLTVVERRLFGHVVNTIGNEWGKSWSTVADVGLKPVRVETNPHHLALFESEEQVMLTTYDVNFAGMEGTITFIIPVTALRPVQKQLASTVLDAGGEDESAWRDPIAASLLKVKLACVAELGTAELSLRELSSLEEGQIVRLDRDPDTPITLYIEGAPKLQGKPAVQHGNLSLEVIGTFRADEEPVAQEKKAS